MRNKHSTHPFTYEAMRILGRVQDENTKRRMTYAEVAVSW